jgi:hypothetical protein
MVQDLRQIESETEKHAVGRVHFMGGQTRSINGFINLPEEQKKKITEFQLSYWNEPTKFKALYDAPDAAAIAKCKELGLAYPNLRWPSTCTSTLEQTYKWIRRMPGLNKRVKQSEPI